MHGWFDLNGGGPVVKDKVFFYASYYRPSISRGNGTNLYGALPDYDSTRNEGYGKVTIQPTHAVLVNGSYRDSHRLETSQGFAGQSGVDVGIGRRVLAQRRHGGRVMGHQLAELRDDDVDALRESDAGPAG